MVMPTSTTITTVADIATAAALVKFLSEWGMEFEICSVWKQTSC